jgi:predicted DNA-binding antitoxin AbrB/MazE fold protein
MGLGKVNFSTAKKVGVSLELAEKVTQEARRLQPEIKEYIKKIDEIPSETLRANWIPGVKKPESITSKV